MNRSQYVVSDVRDQLHLHKKREKAVTEFLGEKDRQDVHEAKPKKCDTALVTQKCHLWALC